MACVNPDCSYIYNTSLLPPALQANPDISGIGVLTSFIGTAYITFMLLVLRYLIGLSTDTNLDESTNPVDQQVLKFIWRKLGKPPARLGEPLKSAILAMSDAQIVTGLSILASGFLQLHCGLSIFHWHIVVFLAWFSSVTHLTTLTFLRRYIHDNNGIRTLRLFLMLLLMVTLVIALVPTGGACGLQNAGLFNYTTGSNSSDSPSWYLEGFAPDAIFPGSPAKCCFSEMLNDAVFVGSDQTYFLSMMASEVVLISSSFIRAIKLFRSSSGFAKRWLRYKPAQMCKYIARKLEEQHENPNSGQRRHIYFVCHCTIIVFIIFARAMYDLAESILWEISWLLFSLAWGTMRILNVRYLANLDAAAVDDDQGEVVLQENFWGFGQFVPILLLVLPLLSLTEGFLGSNTPKQTKSASAEPETESVAATTDDDVAVSAQESPISNESSSTEQQACHLPLHNNPYTELDRNANIGTIRRTSTDLANLERRLGSNAENISDAVTKCQSSSSQGISPTSETSSLSRSCIRLWPAEALYKHDYHTDRWYNDMIICMFVLALELGIELIVFTAGAGSKTITAFIENFTTWRLYVSIILLFCYAALCMMSSQRPEKFPGSLNFLTRFQQSKLRVVSTILRRLFLLVILMMNTPILTLAFFPA